jgi:hypothetical protein
MKKIRLLLLAAVIVAAGSAFTTKQDGFRYFRNGNEIFDTSPCLTGETYCYDIYDESGTVKIDEQIGTWTELLSK